MIAEIKPGQVAQLEVWRDKAIKKINVTVEELKEKTADNRTRRFNNGGGGSDESDSTTVGRIGLTVRTLTAQEKSQVKSKGSVVISNVKGPAAEAGLRPGDIILSINRVKIDTVAQFEAAVKNAGHYATLAIQRDDQQSIITLTLQP
jgi:serine protease Do